MMMKRPCGKFRSYAQKPALRTALSRFRAGFYEKEQGTDVALRQCERTNRYGGMMERAKKIAISIAATFLFGAVFYSVAPAQGEAQPSDPAAYYKAKCVVCHGQKAEKRFDASLTEEQHLDAILKGKKPEKPPNMPAYGEKGVTPEQAKALIDYMKQLRAAQ